MNHDGTKDTTSERPYGRGKMVLGLPISADFGDYAAKKPIGHCLFETLIRVSERRGHRAEWPPLQTSGQLVNWLV